MRLRWAHEQHEDVVAGSLLSRARPELVRDVHRQLQLVLDFQGDLSEQVSDESPGVLSRSLGDPGHPELPVPLVCFQIIAFSSWSAVTVVSKVCTLDVTSSICFPVPSNVSFSVFQRLCAFERFLLQPLDSFNCRKDKGIRDDKPVIVRTGKSFRFFRRSIRMTSNVCIGSSFFKHLVHSFQLLAHCFLCVRVYVFDIAHDCEVEK